MNEKQLIASLATAVDHMQYLISINAALPMREQHERLINSLKNRLRTRQF